MVNRIATFSSTQNLIMGNLQLQSDMADTQTQLSTGLKSTNYKGIASDTQRLLNMENNYSALKAYNTNGQIVSGNVGVMFNSVKSMLDLANNFMTTLTATLSGNFADPVVAKNQADLLSNEAVGLLNTQSGGRYLFAGSNVDTPPVDVTDPGYTPQTTPSTANTSYYQGDNTVLTTQLSETMSIKYGVTANNPAFEKMLRAFNLVSNNPSNTAAITEASGLMQSAIDGISNVYSQLNTYARTIEDQGLRNQEDMTVMDNVISDIKEVDLPATTVKQKALESQIEASYASSVRLLNLKLSDYL